MIKGLRPCVINMGSKTFRAHNMSHLGRNTKYFQGGKSNGREKYQRFEKGGS